MADVENGSLRLPKSLNLNTVVLIAGLGASFWAQWAIFKERGDNQGIQISNLYGRAEAADLRVRQLERDFDKARAQLDELIEAARRRASNDFMPPSFRKPSP